MSDDLFPDDAAQTERTRETILRYHLSWKHRDLDAVMALYHPEIEYNDFYQQRCMRLAELREYVENNLPRRRANCWSTSTASASTGIPPSSSTAPACRAGRACVVPHR